MITVNKITLCDIKTCAVVYDPEEQKPEVYPSEAEARELLLQFRSMPQAEQSRRRVDQKEYVRQKIMKAEDQIRKQQRDNREVELIAFLQECPIGVRSVDECQGYEDLVFLLSFIEEKAKAVAEMKEKKRMMMGDNKLANVRAQSVMDGGSGSGSGSGGGSKEVVKYLHN